MATGDGPAGTDLDDSAAPSHSGGSRPTAQLFTILIVDDDPAFRIVVRRMLLRSGYAHCRIEEADNARDAIAFIQRKPGGLPNVIVSDIFMPVADGYELLIWLREAGLNIPVVAVSAHARDGDSRFDPLYAAERLGAAAVLLKPFDHSVLTATIARVARSVRSASTAG